MNANIGNIDNSRLITSLFAAPACQLSKADTDWFPAVDVTETESEYLAEVDLPGLKAGEIELRVDGECISITGRRAPRPHAGLRVRTERPSGTFIRRLPLPADAQGEIQAVFSDGVLQLRVPRAAKNEARRNDLITPEPLQAVA